MQRTVSGSWIKSSSLALLLYLLTGPGLLHACSTGHIEAGLFSSASPGEGPPDGWRPLTFSRIKQHTDYSRWKRMTGSSSKSSVTRPLPV